MEFARLAASISEMCLLFDLVLKSCDDNDLAHLVTWSGFRGVVEYWGKSENGNWASAYECLLRPMVRFDADERRAIDIDPDSVEAACRRFLGYMTAPEPPSEATDAPDII